MADATSPTDWIAQARARCDAATPGSPMSLARLALDDLDGGHTITQGEVALLREHLDALHETQQGVLMAARAEFVQRERAEAFRVQRDDARTDLQRALDALERVRALIDPETEMADLPYGGGGPTARYFTERDIRAALDGDA